jgi:transcriptional regulatory protein RtcR
MPNIVFGFVGTTLDSGPPGSKRWNRWRPTVSLCAQKDFPVDRLELFVCSSEHEALVQLLRIDIRKISPHTVVVSHLLPISDPWNFLETYSALHDFAKSYVFKDDCQYHVHLTTGTKQANVSLFALTESRRFPAKLVDTLMDKSSDEPWRGRLQVMDLNLAAYDQLASRFAQERTDSDVMLKGGIPTKNLAFNALISKIEKVCLRSSAPILLTGATGTGKSLLASRIFELRQMRHHIDGPFVEVNCATLRGDNAMSTLFGHKKGAFTGAVADRSGLLKAADRGILFLDEIGTLNLDEQAMLLRALEQKSFLPLGSDKEVSSDFQLLAGTNLDLNDEVAAGRFRADLFARINAWCFKLPTLAERPEDIAPNLDFEIDRMSAQLKRRVSFNQAAYERYLAFALTAPWHGNFRDLAASVMRMATMAEGGRILLSDVADEIAVMAGSSPADVGIAADTPLVAIALAGRQMDRYEAAQAEVVLRAVVETTSMADAGRILFAVSRESKKSTNDSHRVRTLLTGWGLEYKDVKAKLGSKALASAANL